MNKKLAFFTIFIGVVIVLFFSMKPKPQSIVSPINDSSSLSLPSPTTEKKKINLVGVTASFDETASLAQFKNVIDKLSLYSPGLYEISDQGGLKKLNVKYRETFLSQARQHNLTIMPLIGDSLSTRGLQTILYNLEVQQQFRQELIAEAQREKFAGFAIDIEKLKPQDEAAFSQFVQNLSADLHSNNLLLKVILFAKTREKSSYPGKAQNYQLIGQYADYVGIMFYTFHNEETAPGAQAPLTWYRETLFYAQSQIPKEKIIVALSTLGFEWPTNGGRGKELTYPQIQKRIETYSGIVSYDAESSSAIVSYIRGGGEYVIWYEDATTIIEKMKIARDEFGMNMFAFWRIGAEDPTLWIKLQDLR